MTPQERIISSAPQELLHNENSLTHQTMKGLASLNFRYSQLVAYPMAEFETGLSKIDDITMVGVLYRDLNAVRPFLDIVVCIGDPLDLTNPGQLELCSRISELHGALAVKLSDPEGVPSGFDSILDYIDSRTNPTYKEFVGNLAFLATHPREDLFGRGVKPRRGLVLGHKKFKSVFVILYLKMGASKELEKYRDIPDGVEITWQGDNSVDDKERITVSTAVGRLFTAFERWNVSKYIAWVELYDKYRGVNHGIVYLVSGFPQVPPQARQAPINDPYLRIRQAEVNTMIYFPKVEFINIIQGIEPDLNGRRVILGENPQLLAVVTRSDPERKVN